jgi:prepilin-type processing-associated H-X9-DG protein
MKFHRPSAIRAFTLIELVVISAVAIGAVCLLIALNSAHRPHKHGNTMKCVSNLKQIGLAFKVFAGDNDDRYPFSASNSVAYLNQSRAWLHFQAMSNELSTAKVLLCPGDRARANNLAENFKWGTNADAKSLFTTTNGSVSYFINLSTDEARPQAILAGDSHIAPDKTNIPYSSKLSGAAVIKVGAQWSAKSPNDLHDGGGNLLLGDGSVSQVNNSILKNQMQLSIDNYGGKANRFLFPQ